MQHGVGRVAYAGCSVPLLLLTGRTGHSMVQIEVERSGGIAGIKRTRSLSTEELSGEDAKTLEGLVDSAGLYELPLEVRAAELGADRFHYRITIHSERGNRTVQIDEAAMPSNVKALLEWINAYAK